MDQQRVALITGSSKGLGKAMAFALGAKGFAVALNYYNGREKAEENASIVHFNCTVGWSNVDEMHANGLQNYSYHERKIWNMLRHGMWLGDIPEGMTVPNKIVEMKPGPLTAEYRRQKRANRGRRKRKEKTQ